MFMYLNQYIKHLEQDMNWFDKLPSKLKKEFLLKYDNKAMDIKFIASLHSKEIFKIKGVGWSALFYLEAVLNGHGYNKNYAEESRLHHKAYDIEKLKNEILTLKERQIKLRKTYRRNIEVRIDKEHKLKCLEQSS